MVSMGAIVAYFSYNTLWAVVSFSDTFGYFGDVLLIALAKTIPLASCVNP